MNAQSENAHLHNMWGEFALITAVIINSFGVVLMLYSAAGISAISSVPYAFSLGSSKTLPRNLDIHIPGFADTDTHDHEEEIRTTVSVQLHSWIYIWQNA